MQTVLTDEVTRRALRGRICPSCASRPAGSELSGADEARICEKTCAIFENLKTLKTIALRFQGQRLSDYDQAIHDEVCQHCSASPTAGEFCPDDFERTCPLSLHARLVLSIIESLLPRRTAVN